MVTWEISNAVVTIYFNVKLPLDKIANLIPYAQYDPETFPGLIIPLKEGGNKEENVKALVFNSGTINISGIKRLEDIEYVAEKLRELFKQIDIELPKDYKIKVQNIVVNGKFDYDNIDIVRLADEIPDSQYNPEAFPAVTVTFEVSENYRVKFNVFKNGKFVCPGLKGEFSNFDEIKKHVDYVLNSFQEKVIKKYVKK